LASSSTEAVGQSFRPDSLRRHLENVQLNRFPKGPVPCPREICNGQEFENEYAWLSHAATMHKYDLHVKLHRSATLPRVDRLLGL
jgi:hypothetical protein